MLNCMARLKPVSCCRISQSLCIQRSLHPTFFAFNVLCVQRQKKKSLALALLVLYAIFSAVCNFQCCTQSLMLYAIFSAVCNLQPRMQSLVRLQYSLSAKEVRKKRERSAKELHPHNNILVSQSYFSYCKITFTQWHLAFTSLLLFTNIYSKVILACSLLIEFKERTTNGSLFLDMQNTTKDIYHLFH